MWYTIWTIITECLKNQTYIFRFMWTAPAFVKWLFLFTKCFVVYRFTSLTLWIERESERQSKSFRFCFWTSISLSQVQWSLTHLNLILNVFQAIIRDPFMLNAVILVFANKQDMVSLWYQWICAPIKCNSCLLSIVLSLCTAFLVLFFKMLTFYQKNKRYSKILLTLLCLLSDPMSWPL